MGMQIREAPITWVQDLNGSTSTTVYPSGANAGIANPYVGRRGSSRIHLGLDYTVASGTMSVQVSLYGLTDAMSAGAAATWATSTWVYLGAMNGGASITASNPTWSQSATRITFTEVFAASGENYSRYATRAYGTGGASPVVSTYVGFCGD